MPAVLARDLLKVFGLISTFAATLAITAVVLVCAARWFLQAEGVLIPRETSRFAIVSRGFSELARRKALAVLVVGVACLLIRGAVLPLLKTRLRATTMSSVICWQLIPSRTGA